VALAADQQDFLRRLKEAAGVAEARGVPAAVMVAQGIIESGWGRSGLARLGHAAFGVKADATWGGPVYSGTTAEWEGGRYVTYHGTGRVYPSRAEALAAGAHAATVFRAYRTLAESILDHTEFFHRNRRYALCLEAYARDRDAWAFAACIHRAGYATSPTYTQTLHTVMRQHAADLVAAPPGPPADAPSLPSAPVAVVIDGRPLAPDAVRMQDGAVWVRVRPAFEAAGMAVVWDGARRVVEVRRLA
jgi:flagellum-specific peptidoglycan hydrolase FlgJ